MNSFFHLSSSNLSTHLHSHTTHRNITDDNRPLSAIKNQQSAIMPPKTELDEDLVFLWTCLKNLKNSDKDFKALGVCPSSLCV